MTLTAAPSAERTPPPSRRGALSQLARVRPADYARTRNHLAGAVTGLSPYITHGLLTLPEVMAALLARGPLPVGHKLVYELGWREFFRHVWAHRGEGILQSLHEGPLPEGAYAPQLPADLRAACTGVPVVDQAVRTLYATGGLHNHARMWLASYLVHVRRVHWRAGADWMVAHLLDGDLASNHLSWQWVCGTGSHKPYLFNAENVARYAPASWHSPGTVIDQPYEVLERMARGLAAAGGPGPASVLPAGAEPAGMKVPPEGLGVSAAPGEVGLELAGRPVWLVHPWALRAPPPDLPAGTQVLGLYLREFHQRWPWSERRWRWVDAAMAEVAPQRVYLDVERLRALLAPAARVRSVDDPHLGAWLRPWVQLDPAPRLFPQVDRLCSSFSQWWSRASRDFDPAAGSSAR